MKIYIVMGMCGEYSDRDEWVIRAYCDKNKAERHVSDAEKFSYNHAKECEKLDDIGEYDDLGKAESPFDPNFKQCSIPSSSYQTTYFLTETELEE